MIIPKLKGLSSPDLNRPALPEDPANCSVLVDAEVGDGGQGADIFSFTVVTPSYLAKSNDTRWGRGLLVVPEFSWSGVERALGNLLAHASGETWEKVAESLGKELHWEFENYSES